MRGTSTTAWATLPNLASSMGYSLIGAIETYVHGAILTRRHHLYLHHDSHPIHRSHFSRFRVVDGAIASRLFTSAPPSFLSFFACSTLPLSHATTGMHGRPREEKKRKEYVLGTNHGGQPTAGKFHYSYKPKHIAHQREVSGMRLARALCCCEIMMLSGSSP